MDTIRLLVCILLAVPCGIGISRVSETFIAERPLFRPSDAPRFAPRVVTICSVTLVVFAALAWRFSDVSWIELLCYLAGFAAVLLASAIDLTEYRLPDAVVLPSISLGIMLVIIVSLAEGSPGRIREALIGSAIAFSVLLVAHLISPRGMGFGDVKFAALLGLMVGWQANDLPDVIVLVLWLLLIGFAFGTIGGLALMVLRGRNQSFPFGPFLAAGTFFAVVFSRALIS